MTTAPPIGVALGVDRARSQSLGDLPRRSALRTPTKLAIIAPDDAGGEVRLTFAELDDAIDGVAAAMHDAGLVKGDRLVLLSHNCWQFPIIAFATARIGVILVPVNFMLGATDVAFIVEHSECAAVVVEDSLISIMEEALSLVSHTVSRRVSLVRPGESAPDGWRDAAEWLDHRATPPHVDVADEDPIRIMYTSGTESRPKGAVLTSRSLLWQYVSCVVDAEMSAEDVELHALPLYHCAQLDVFLIPDIYIGATSIIVPEPSPATVLEAIEKYRVTKFFAPPTVWIGLLNSPEWRTRDVTSLTKAYYGASPMPVEILRRLTTELPTVRLRNMYGQTELAPLATMLPPHEQSSFAGSAGRPVLNVETAIMDDRGAMVAVGEVGEIVHRSPQAIIGYFRDEEKTNAAFTGGWFHTGDLGFISATGHLYVVDRKKDMIKSGGENVSSREVEEALYSLEGVAEVAVIGLPDDVWIEAVTAVVVRSPGSELTEEAVLVHARERLSTFKRPKRVLFRESLPKNPSGKIVKRRLRDECA